MPAPPPAAARPRLLVLSLYFHPALRYGGPVASTWLLCRGLAARGFGVRVLTTDADGPARLPVAAGWQTAAEGLAVRYCRRHGGELFAPAMATRLPREVRRADLVYVSGLFVWPLPLAALLARLGRRPLVVAPRGMLFPAALAGKRLRKRFFMGVLAACGAARAVFHVTSDAEAETVRAHFPRGRLLVVPNPVEVPAEMPAAAARPEPGAAPYLLFLGRLHPHKQVAEILTAFARAVSAGGEGEALPLAELWLAGEGEESYRGALAARAEELGIAARVRFLPQTAGEAKSRLLAGAIGLVLASRSENFGQSVAEALAHGTPAVVTATAPWPGLERERCGFWVEATTEGLAAGLRRLLALDAGERRAMGARGRAWMERDFAAAAVAARMAAALSALVHDGGRHAG